MERNEEKPKELRAEDKDSQEIETLKKKQIQIFCKVRKKA